MTANDTKTAIVLVTALLSHSSDDEACPYFNRHLGF
jgi:hypothetical protein